MSKKGKHRKCDLCDPKKAKAYLLDINIDGRQATFIQNARGECIYFKDMTPRQAVIYAHQLSDILSKHQEKH